MSLRPQEHNQVPEETLRVARAAFRKGNPYMTLRDELGALYNDELFASLFASPRGRPVESPGCLAVVTVLQFVENLSDRQAADEVRGRIDWKYLLGLELTDSGFDFTLLSDFRARVLQGGIESQLLTSLLERFRARQLLKSHGRQRTDSTHVLSGIREMNRLESVGETLRSALNILAAVAPDWLRGQVSPDWFERYDQRFDQWRLPEKPTERAGLGQTIGQDGYHLLQAVYASNTPAWLREIPAVDILRRVWLQQYYVEGDTLRWRKAEELPPAAQLIVSSYDADARISMKRSTEWTGYKVHVTETCEDSLPLVIVNVETTPSTTPDVACTTMIHQHLADKDLLPNEHLLDAGYVDAEALVESQNRGIDLIGPVSAERSWQARAGEGFDIPNFMIDWEGHVVTCPAGKCSVSWSESLDSRDVPVIQVQFAKQDCPNCSRRTQCTRSAKGVRTLKLQSQERQTALLQARQRQETPEFKEQYKRRAGVEGTISQGVRKFDLRRSRYKGLPKTHLQHILTAIAINLMRLVDWFAGTPRAGTRCSTFAALAPV